MRHAANVEMAHTRVRHGHGNTKCSHIFCVNGAQELSRESLRVQLVYEDGHVVYHVKLAFSRTRMCSPSSRILKTIAVYVLRWEGV